MPLLLRAEHDHAAAHFRFHHLIVGHRPGETHRRPMQYGKLGPGLPQQQHGRPFGRHTGGKRIDLAAAGQQIGQDKRTRRHGLQLEPGRPGQRLIPGQQVLAHHRRQQHAFAGRARQLGVVQNDFIEAFEQFLGSLEANHGRLFIGAHGRAAQLLEQDALFRQAHEQRRRRNARGLEELLELLAGLLALGLAENLLLGPKQGALDLRPRARDIACQQLATILIPVEHQETRHDVDSSVASLFRPEGPVLSAQAVRPGKTGKTTGRLKGRFSGRTMNDPLYVQFRISAHESGRDSYRRVRFCDLAQTRSLERSLQPEFSCWPAQVLFFPGAPSWQTGAPVEVAWRSLLTPEARPLPED